MTIQLSKLCMEWKDNVFNFQYPHFEFWCTCSPVSDLSDQSFELELCFFFAFMILDSGSQKYGF